VTDTIATDRHLRDR